MGNLLNIALRGFNSSGIATVNWTHGYIASCTTRSFAIFKNGVQIASGNGSTYQTGSFTVAVNDVIRMDSTSGAIGTSCSGASVKIFRDATQVASNTVVGLNTTATASWTVATVQATYLLQGGDVV